MENLWQQLSKEISDKVAAAGESIVAVDGRSGHTSSGIVWRPDYILTASHAIRGEGAIEVLSSSGKSVGATHHTGRDCSGFPKTVADARDGF